MPRAKAEPKSETADLSPEAIGDACAAVVAQYAKPNINARTMLMTANFWADITKALRGEVAPPPADNPDLTSLSPATAEKDSPDFTLSCIGTGFNATSVIVFAGNDEPTTLVSDTEVTTGVKPSLGWGTDVGIPVSVRNGEVYTGVLDFIFTAAPVADEADAEDELPDDLSDTTTKRRKRKW